MTMQQWAEADTAPWAKVNENFQSLEHQAVYGKRQTATSGLTWGYYGGRWGGFSVADGALTLSASQTNYLVVLRATGVISSSTSITNWDNAIEYARVYKIVTGASGVTGEPEDHRAGPGGVHGGESAGSGASLTHFVEGVNSAAPNATKPVASLTASNAATDLDAVFSPKGSGAILAQVPTATSVGGDKRGGYAVDLQRIRANQNQVASGAFAVLAGGQSNRVSGQDAVCGGGNANSSTAVASAVAGGASNSASADYASVCGGANNSASAAAASVGGGINNQASGVDSTIPGGRSASTRGLTGAYACASGQFSAVGDAQMGRYVQRRSTTDATPAALSANGGAPAAATAVVLPNSACYAFRARVSARSATDSAGFEIAGVIKRGIGAGTTALVGTPAVTALGADAGASTWAVSAVANTTLGGLEISVTGAAATSIKWVAVVDTTELVG